MTMTPTRGRVGRSLALLVTVCLAAAASQAQSTPEGSLLDWAQASQRRTAHGLYLMGAKIGWVLQETRVEERDGDPVFVDQMTTTFKAGPEDAANVSELTETSVWSLTGEGALRSYVSREVDDGTVILRSAEPEDGELVIIDRAAGRNTTRQVPMPRATLVERRRFQAWLRSDPRPGNRFELPSLSWDQVDIDNTETLEAIGRRSIVSGGQPLVIEEVWLTTESMRGHAEFRLDGTLLRMRAGLFMEMRLEPEELAMDLDATVDLMAVTSLPVDQALGDPGAVDELRVVLLGEDGLQLPSAPRQSVTRDDAGQLVLHLKREAPVELQALSAAEQQRFIGPTPRIQSDDPELRQLVASLIDESARPEQNARSLVSWVFTELEGSLTSNASTALDVLANRSGDCSEHALLFVAMARAAGIPAREVTGIMYGDTDPPVFGWHAWAEFHNGRGWVSIDPAWGQLPVDATHIKFANEQDLSWVSHLGDVSLQVLEVQRAEPGSKAR